MAKGKWILVAVLSMGSLASAGERRTLVLIWQDPRGLVPHFGPIRAEAEKLLETLCADIRWEVGTNPRPSSLDELRIQIVLMPSEPSGWKLSPHAMGVVLLPERRQQQSVFLFHPAILRGVGLGRRAGAMLTPPERQQLGRAMGRVLVHEVIHAVAPSLSHADFGVMHDALRPGALWKNDVSVDARSREAFQEGLEATAAPE